MSTWTSSAEGENGEGPGMAGLRNTSGLPDPDPPPAEVPAGAHPSGQLPGPVQGLRGESVSTRSSMGRRAVVTWGEQDAFTGWRRVLCYLQKPGAMKWNKTRANRRDRRLAKLDARQEREA